MKNLAKTLFASVLVAFTGLGHAAFAGTKIDFNQSRDVPSVDFVNLSSDAIWSIQMSNIDDPEWPDEDLLGDETIDGSKDAWLSPQTSGNRYRFDALITYANGSKVTVWDVNLQEVSTIEVKENGYTRVA